MKDNVNNFLIHTNILTMITISSFYYCKKMFILYETLLPKKEDFSCHLNMEDIADADYVHAKGVCKNFEIKKLREYHNLYFQSDTLRTLEICVLKYMNLIL